MPSQDVDAIKTHFIRHQEMWIDIKLFIHIKMY